MNQQDTLYTYFHEEAPMPLPQRLDNRMQEFNLSQRLSSDVLGIERKTLQRILSQEHQKIDILTLLKIGYFLNISIDELIKISVASMTVEEIKELEQAKKSTFILENFDLEGLKKIGFIQDKFNFEEIEQKILSFFGITSIYDYQRELGLILFSQTKRNINDKMREFWLKSIDTAFKTIANPHEYKPELLRQLLEKIPAYSQNEEFGLITVIKALYMVGVTVLVQPYPTNTQIKGATLLIKKKPCIVLTDYNKRYDTLWFSLIHELYHVLYDYDVLLKANYHLTGENDLFLIEENANRFARELLLSSEKTQYVYKIINVPFMVEKFARKCSIHTSIIYGFYIYENPTENMKYRRLIKSSEKSLQKIKHNLLDTTSTKEGAIHIKETILNTTM
jgi:HTH-type transcriptional regulator/antitoxin HigA